ncbi:MAG: lytic transglycosylase domain-containing protein, partial [Bdellovibrionota bacterium]
MNRGRRTFAALLSFSLPFLAAALSSSFARAAYDRPFSWSDVGEIDLKPVFRSFYASEDNLLDPQIPASAFELALADADHRISDEFAIPKTLTKAVEFWLHIYARYTTREVVIFDDRHPEVVYEVLDFRPLSKSARNRVAYEIMMERKIARVRQHYKSAFASLLANPKKKSLNEYESKIKQALTVCDHKHPMAFHSGNLRIQRGQRDNIIKGLLAAEAFFPKMETIFDDLGVPPEITRLALVESSFNIHAVSYAGATGVWQFMLKSGLEYLKIDSGLKVDERLSPLKSTVAAARLLKRNRKVLRNWPFAITAYNHGLRTFVQSPRGRTGKESLDPGNLFGPCPKNGGLKLGWASRNYYAEFLAVLHAEKY